MKFDLTIETDLRAFNTQVEYLLRKTKKVELKEIRKARSVTQNAYLHVAITLFAMEYGYTILEAKTMLKRECSFMVYEKNDIKFLKETKKMNSKELTEFIEWIRNYASENGLYIPTSQEYLDNKFNIDKEISKNKTHL